MESPAKANTIQKYLGADYEVMASMGHIIDLPKSKLGIDIENGFAPVYQPMKDKEALIKQLTKAAKKSEFVYLATDPDREGEAISWHLARLLSLDERANNRVEFNEITKSGVKHGMEHPRNIDMDLVNAQQARRILDRIVGYQLSPFLWRKIRRGLSAGRVQSVAVRLICDREEQISAFREEEYWTIDARLSKAVNQRGFAAALHSKNGKKLSIGDEETANAIVKELDGQTFTVAAIKQSVRKKNPAPPFITSTLQQDASRKLGFQARRTMKAAQELYEGVTLPGLGAVGLITYMRTDSLRISADAQEAARAYIGKAFGNDYLPAAAPVYKTKKNAQDAHEAVRPTMIDLEPKKVKDSLTADQYKLYKLIWERFIASQMSPALLDTMSVDIKVLDYLFKASGYKVKFDGFTALYEEGKDEKDEKSEPLPALTEGMELKVKELLGNQHFTQPPPRYTEASLIKAMEENGIGRPSTYAPTISTITARMYVEREGKTLKPTALGTVINTLMKERFSQVVDVTFTASMEEELDKVETGNADWVETLGQFYGDFAATLEEAEKQLDGTRIKVPDEVTDEKCDLCGRNLVVKIGRFGKFLGCPGFPECKFIKKIVHPTGGICPKCGGRLLIKKSKGRGRQFFGCENYPECEFVTWDQPVPDVCSKCGQTMFKKGNKLFCAQCDEKTEAKGDK